MTTPDQPLTPAQAESLTANSEPWLSCDDCFDRIDGYVDALIRDGGVLDEPLRVHLARCPACHEEAGSLISLTADDRGVSADKLLAAFHHDLGLPVVVSEKSPGFVARLLRRNRDGDSC